MKGCDCMKKTVIDWDIRKNGRYLLSMLALCGIVPHGMLLLLHFASMSDSWSPAEIEIYGNFFVCQWIPFWLAFLPYLRLQKADNFSLLPALAAVLIVATYYPRFAQRSVTVVALTIPLMLVMELTAFLKTAQGSGNKALACIAADRVLLRAFWFWTLEFLCVIFISCEACTFPTTVVSPFLMLPIPGILLFDVMHRQNKQPPGIYSVAGMLAVVPPALYLAGTGPMEKFKVYHLMSLAAGFAILFLMLIVYNIDRWKGKNSAPGR